MGAADDRAATPGRGGGAVIIHAGGLTLEAPDTVPDAARQPLDALHQQARFGLALPNEVHTALERAAFGEEAAARLRRAGHLARLQALQQLLACWGELEGGRPSPLARARRAEPCH
jgi:hypothetical protein